MNLCVGSSLLAPLFPFFSSSISSDFSHYCLSSFFFWWFFVLMFWLSYGSEISDSITFSDYDPECLFTRKNYCTFLLSMLNYSRISYKRQSHQLVWMKQFSIRWAKQLVFSLPQHFFRDFHDAILQCTITSVTKTNGLVMRRTVMLTSLNQYLVWPWLERPEDPSRTSCLSWDERAFLILTDDTKVFQTISEIIVSVFDICPKTSSNFTLFKLSMFFFISRRN